MATTIEQRPLYSNAVPVGQEVIFAISNNNIVAQFTNVSFQADVYISNGTPPTVTGTPLATFKTKPNNVGVGIFDFRQVVESYVSSDNVAAEGSSYKTALTNIETSNPIHLIDKYSKNRNAVRWLTIQFKTIYTNASGNEAEDTPITSIDYRLFDGYLKYTNIIELSGNGSFGYNPTDLIPSNDTKQFLTNAPIIQYANLEDYGTFAFLSMISNNGVAGVRLTYYDSSGVQIGTEIITRNQTNGADTSPSTDVSGHLLYFGCFPANLQNWSSTFQALVTAETIQGGSITVQALSGAFIGRTKIYTININCPNLKGYESVRLAWLNQWGAWDYYTFTQKSVRSITTKGSTYEQLAGTWNESRYRVNGYKGGKKSFRVNATEKIKMNTDFVSENENIMFEELINSPEVYILDGYSSVFDVTTNLNQYVTPVRITSTNFTKKTVANDKLIQYTFEVEKSKTLRTQSI